jgi:hypothetical protein
MAVPNSRNDSWLPGGAAEDLLARASAVLAREAERLRSTTQAPAPQTAPVVQGVPLPEAAVDLSDRVCPVTGMNVLPYGSGKKDLRQQAHELIAGLFSAFGATSGYPAGATGGSAARPIPGGDQRLLGAVCPITKATVPFAFDRDRLRKQAHAFIETLLVTFNDSTGERGLPTEDKVPLVQCEAPVQAGNQARAVMTVGNEESTPSDVALYCTNFVSDSGTDIPALRVSVSPRRATIPPNAEATFQITIAVPQQTPAGTYSGLIQAMGTKYVKAVLSLDVT